MVPNWWDPGEQLQLHLTQKKGLEPANKKVGGLKEGEVWEEGETNPEGRVANLKEVGHKKKKEN